MTLKPLTPLDIIALKQGAFFYMRKPGTETTPDGPFRFIRLEKSDSRIYYSHPDDSPEISAALCMSVQMCDAVFFVQPTTDEIAAIPAPDPAPSPPLPRIDWTTTPGAAPGEIFGKVIMESPPAGLITKHPLWMGELYMQREAANIGEKYYIRLQTWDRGFYFGWNDDTPPDFETVERLTRAWQHGRELGNEEGREAVLNAVKHAGKILMPFARAFWREGR
jgi:hypothetical protein